MGSVVCTSRLRLSSGSHPRERVDEDVVFGLTQHETAVGSCASERSRRRDDPTVAITPTVPAVPAAEWRMVERDVEREHCGLRPGILRLRERKQVMAGDEACGVHTRLSGSVPFPNEPPFVLPRVTSVTC